MADRVKVTLIKSTIGAVPKNKKTIEALGLTKLGKTVELPNNAATQGAVRKVAPYWIVPCWWDNVRLVRGWCKLLVTCLIMGK